MSSMRKLNRRLLRWHRYDDRITGRRDETRRVTVPPGLRRAALAVEREEERRFWDDTPEVWLGGPEGEAALRADVLDDDYRCCDAGDDGHPGPCVTTCSDCWGGGKCPECGGVDDLGCAECGGSGSCGGCWGQGEHVEDLFGNPVGG